jgi:hypothetical protein
MSINNITALLKSIERGTNHLYLLLVPFPLKIVSGLLKGGRCWSMHIRVMSSCVWNKNRIITSCLPIIFGLHRNAIWSTTAIKERNFCAANRIILPSYDQYVASVMRRRAETVEQCSKFAKCHCAFMTEVEVEGSWVVISSVQSYTTANFVGLG